MAKFLFSILLAAIIASADGLSGVARADTFQRGDYASLSVPDIAQASSFFRNVLNCEAIDGTPASTRSALMICEKGMVIELVTASRDESLGKAKPLRFVINDVAHAERWLQRNGARVIGHAVLPMSGPDAGQTLVNFIAPWGQRLQLAGPTDPRITAVP